MGLVLRDGLRVTEGRRARGEARWVLYCAMESSHGGASCSGEGREKKENTVGCAWLLRRGRVRYEVGVRQRTTPEHSGTSRHRAKLV